MCDNPPVESGMFKCLSLPYRKDGLPQQLANEYETMKRFDKTLRTDQPERNFIKEHPPYRKTNSDFFKHSRCTRKFFYDASRIPPRKDKYSGEYNPFGLDHPIIACSAPLPETLFAFWAMVYQTSVETNEGRKALIVMVTDLEEYKNGERKEKATQYWPDDTPLHLPSLEDKLKGTEIQSIEVKLENTQIIAGEIQEKDPYIMERTLRVVIHKEQSQSEEMIVTQLHVMNWVDNDVVDAHVLLRLTCRMMQFTKSLTTEERYHFAPIVHCSMGVGRSSAVVLAYSFLFTVLKKSNEKFEFSEEVLKDQIDEYISYLRSYRGCFVPDCQFTLLALETIRILLGYEHFIDPKLKPLEREKVDE